MNLFTVPATHRCGLGASRVDVGPELVLRGERRSLGFLDGSIDLGLRLLVHGLEVVLRRQAPFSDVTLETTDGILGRADALDLLTGTVGSSRVGHAVDTRLDQRDRTDAESEQ